jgi:hypothetical protein
LDTLITRMTAQISVRSVTNFMAVHGKLMHYLWGPCGSRKVALPLTVSYFHRKMYPRNSLCTYIVHFTYVPDIFDCWIFRVTFLNMYQPWE